MPPALPHAALFRAAFSFSRRRLSPELFLCSHRSCLSVSFKLTTFEEVPLPGRLPSLEVARILHASSLLYLSYYSSYCFPVSCFHLILVLLREAAGSSKASYCWKQILGGHCREGKGKQQKENWGKKEEERKGQTYGDLFSSLRN